MIRLRLIVTLAICALLSGPLSAAALEFQANSEQSPPSSVLASDEVIISLQETPILPTNAVFKTSTASQMLSDGVAGGLVSGPSATLTILAIPPVPVIALPDADFQAFRTPLFRRGPRARARLIRFNIRTAALPTIPEPTTAVLLGIGLAGLVVAGRQQGT